MQPTPATTAATATFRPWRLTTSLNRLPSLCLRRSSEGVGAGVLRVASWTSREGRLGSLFVRRRYLVDGRAVEAFARRAMLSKWKRSTGLKKSVCVWSEANSDYCPRRTVAESHEAPRFARYLAGLISHDNRHPGSARRLKRHVGWFLQAACMQRIKIRSSLVARM